jgi:hypothetical protein
MSGMVNIVGDHATYHRQYDAPLTSDIEGLARPNSHWVKTSPDSKAIAGDGAHVTLANQKHVVETGSKSGNVHAREMSQLILAVSSPLLSDTNYS